MSNTCEYESFPTTLPFVVANKLHVRWQHFFFPATFSHFVMQLFNVKLVPYSMCNSRRSIRPLDVERWSRAMKGEEGKEERGDREGFHSDVCPVGEGKKSRKVVSVHPYPVRGDSAGRIECHICVTTPSSQRMCCSLQMPIHLFFVVTPLFLVALSFKLSKTGRYLVNRSPDHP